MEGLENPLETLERQLRAAGHDAAEVARVDARLLAEPVARAVALLDEIRQVVAVVWRSYLPLGDAEPGFQVLADAVGQGVRRECRAEELGDPPRGELGPLGSLREFPLHGAQELAFLFAEPTKLKRPASDRLISAFLHLLLSFFFFS